MKIKRYVVEYANDEKAVAMKWMDDKYKYSIYCEYLDYIVKNYKNGFYTASDAVKLIYDAYEDLQSKNWEY